MFVIHFHYPVVDFFTGFDVPGVFELDFVE